LGARKADGSTPIQMIFLPETINIIFAGKTKTETGTEAHLFGSYSSERKTSIDSITGEQLSEATEKKYVLALRLITKANFEDRGDCNDRVDDEHGRI
jgi:hypothetical protein